MTRIALVGLGKMGLSHLSLLRPLPGVEVVGVCDSTGYVLDVLGKYTGLPTFTDYAEMLRTATPDAVVVATPTHLHEPMVRAALEHGIHVFCEKPLVLDPVPGCGPRAARRRARVWSPRSATTTGTSAPSRRPSGSSTSARSAPCAEPSPRPTARSSCAPPDARGGHVAAAVAAASTTTRPTRSTCSPGTSVTRCRSTVPTSRASTRPRPTTPSPPPSRTPTRPPCSTSTGPTTPSARCRPGSACGATPAGSTSTATRRRSTSAAGPRCPTATRRAGTCATAPTCSPPRSSTCAARSTRNSSRTSSAGSPRATSRASSTFASALATDRVIAAIRGADADPPRAVVVAAPDEGTAPPQPPTTAGTHRHRRHRARAVPGSAPGWHRRSGAARRAAHDRRSA